MSSLSKKMEKLVSNWYNLQSLPENYVFPQGKRPGNLIVPVCRTIPVIDLGKTAAGCDDHAEIISNIIKASQEFGFFQVLNHGISSEIMEETMDVCNKFFGMDAEEKARFYSEDPNRDCRLYTSSLRYPNEKNHFWRDTLKHHSHPLEECMQYWPDKPTKYREIMGAYSREVKKLSRRILELISEGLGLEFGYLGDELSESQLMLINNYPPCPDPSLTLGLAKHCDPNLITILQQGDVCGLQVFKDGQWLSVDPIPSAFVVNIGLQLQIISNGKLKSVEHRAVTNSSKVRTTIVTFMGPSNESIIQPAKALINESSPQRYKPIQYKDFFGNYVARGTEAHKMLDIYEPQV